MQYSEEVPESGMVETDDDYADPIDLCLKQIIYRRCCLRGLLFYRP